MLHRNILTKSSVAALARSDVQGEQTKEEGWERGTYGNTFLSGEKMRLLRRREEGEECLEYKLEGLCYVPTSLRAYNRHWDNKLAGAVRNSIPRF